MDVVLIIGRVLFSLIFIGSGAAGHFAQVDGTTGYAEMRGVKNGRILVQLSGALLILIAVGVIAGIWIDLAALLAIAWLLVANVMVHHFWNDTDAMMRQIEMTNFMKNLSMAGGALIMFALADQMGPTITDPLF
jgi:uncharacterized membrane protein YphA (DoxX/SURF4 family)